MSQVLLQESSCRLKGLVIVSCTVTVKQSLLSRSSDGIIHVKYNYLPKFFCQLERRVIDNGDWKLHV